MISIIIPTYNRIKSCRRVVESILASRFDDEYEIIVVDDNSSKLPDFSDLKNVQLLSKKENSGPSSSRNLGVEASSGEIIFFMDDDIAVSEDIIAQHLSVYRKKQDTTAIVSNVTYVSEDGSRGDKLNNYFNTRGMNRFKSGELLDGQYFGTGFCSIRKDFFVFIGGFEESFKVYGWEDPELGLRIEKNGGKILFQKSNGMFHYDSKGVVQLVKQLSGSGENFNYIMKNYPQYRNRFRFDFLNSTAAKIIFNTFLFRIMLFFGASLPGKLSFPFLKYLYLGSIYKSYHQS